MIYSLNNMSTVIVIKYKNIIKKSVSFYERYLYNVYSVVYSFKFMILHYLSLIDYFTLFIKWNCHDTDGK